MEQQVKQRIVGAAVLCALAVIFVPMLFDDSEPVSGSIEETNIPRMPEGEFSSRIVPLDTSVPPPIAETPPAGTQGSEGEDTDATMPEAQEGEADTGDDAAAPRVGLTAWAVQLGSFAEEDNARKLESRLRESGHSAFVEKLLEPDTTVYRVRVGPELLRADAEKLRASLAEEFKLDAIVVRYP